MSWSDTRKNSEVQLLKLIVANGNSSILASLDGYSKGELLTCLVEKTLRDGTPITPKI